MAFRTEDSAWLAIVRSFSFKPASSCSNGCISQALAKATGKAILSFILRDASGLSSGCEDSMKPQPGIVRITFAQQHKIIAGSRARVLGSHREAEGARDSFDGGSGLDVQGPPAPVFRPWRGGRVHCYCFKRKYRGLLVAGTVTVLKPLAGMTGWPTGAQVLGCVRP